MELWEILITAAAGLSAGQIGAWLQARRDQRVELQRQAAETERLRLQLTDAREQHEGDRKQTDTHEWRERRLAAYQAVSSASNRMLSNAGAVTRMKAQPAVSAAADRCHEDCRELQDALDLCSIIGTDRTRSAALDFAIRAEELDRAVSEFDYHVHWISADPEDGQAEAIDSLEAVHALILGQTVGHVTEEIEQLVTLDKAVGVALDGVAAKNETWLRAARSEVLGVPE